MLEATQSPEIAVEDLMDRVREEIARPKAPQDMLLAGSSGAPPPAGDTAARGPLSLRRLPAANQHMPHKESYSLSDFLDFHDEAFVANGYRGLLMREPDSQGLVHYLGALRSGRLSKIEILGRLRFSKEGRRCAVKVKGLFLPFAVRTLGHVPVIGYLVALATFVMRLPLVIKNWERFEAHVLFEQQEQRNHVDALTSDVEKALAHLYRDLVSKSQTDPQLLVLRRDLADSSRHLLDILENKAETLRAQFDSRLLELTGALDLKASCEQVQEVDRRLIGLINTTLEAARSDIQSRLDQDRRLALLLEEVRQTLSETVSEEQAANLVQEGDHLLDALYVAFEDRFRGTREEIKRQMTFYLPLLREAGVGTADAPLLDIGCGRGEWLELLKENGFNARGIDINRIMVAHCRDLLLDVSEDEALQYLRRQEAATFGSITGMHIIEHIPLRPLVALLDEVLRVLKPGGMAIFETPNPENLVVGACSFYYDPTHLRPLPPQSTHFLLEARGFVNVELFRLHPLRSFQDVFCDTPLVNNLFAGPQDYCLVARKA